MSLHKQFGPEIRPYKIWIQLPNGTWTLRREGGPRTRKTTKQKVRCVKNCGGGVGVGVGGEPPVCRIIISDAVGILLDVVVFGNPTINIQDPWGDVTVQN